MATSSERVASANKRLIYAGVALGGIALSAIGAAAFVGGAVAARMSAQTAALSKLLPGLKVHEDVERGVFHSTRTVTLRLGCAPAPADSGKLKRTPPLVLRWRDEIHHGPFPAGRGFGAAVIDSDLSVVEGLEPQVKQVFGDQPPLSAHTRIGFGGSFESDVTVPAIKLAPAAAEQLTFSGLSGRVTGRLPLGKGTLRYSWSEAPLTLSVTSPDVRLKLELGPVDMSGDVQMDADRPSLLVPVQGEASIESMKLVSDPPSPGGVAPVPFELVFSRVKAKSEAKLDKDLYTTTSDMAGTLKVNGFTVDKFEVGSGLRRLHAPTYAKLLTELIDLGLSCEKKIDDPLAALPELADTAFALLPHDPEYGVGPIAIELAGKRAEVSYRVGTRGITLKDKSVPMAALLAQKAVARADAKAHLGLIDEVAKIAGKALTGGSGAQPLPGTPDPTALMARAMVDKAVSEGFLVREGDFVRGTIESVAGELKLNGKPFAMPDIGLGGP